MPMSWAATDPVLRALAKREPIEAPVAVVVAHPDDETIGAGTSLRLFRRLVLVHVTDGAPRDLRDTRAAGFETCADYASARARELRNALDVGQFRPSPPIVDATRVDATVDATLEGLPLPDQTASLHLGWLAATLRAMLRGMSAVITHAYEGGHPDHDAVAFAVQATAKAAIESLHRENVRTVMLTGALSC
jgi:N-acetylglucosamine malate deacetylase 2